MTIRRTVLWPEPSKTRMTRIVGSNLFIRAICVQFIPKSLGPLQKFGQLMGTLASWPASRLEARVPSKNVTATHDHMAETGTGRDDFIPALLSNITMDSGTYALPKDWGTLGLVYLPEAFAEAGIDEPTLDWTRDDLRAAAAAIATIGEYAGFCKNADWARFAPWAFGNGGAYASDDLTTALANSDPVIEEAEYIAAMHNDGSLPPFMPPGSATEFPAAYETVAHNDLTIFIPLEDLRDGWEVDGAIGQEIYGAGMAPAMAALSLVELAPGLVVYSGYPLVDISGEEITFAGIPGTSTPAVVWGAESVSNGTGTEIVVEPCGNGLCFAAEGGSSYRIMSGARG